MTEKKKESKKDKTALIPLATTLTDEQGGLSRYLTRIRAFPLLEAQEEYRLAKEYTDDDNLESAHILVTSHLRLAAKIAMGYRGYGLPMNEVVSEGNLGLMKAVKKFDPERGFRLATYAMWWIRASIQEYVLRSWSLVKIGTTSAQKKLFFNLRRLKGELGAIDGGQMHPDQVHTIAEKLDVRDKDVREMEGRMYSGDQSLNTPHGGQFEDSTGDASEWQDWLEDDTPTQEAALVEQDDYDHRQQLMLDAMSTLDEREQAILQARRLSDPPQTLEVVSKTFNISRERVRQLEERAFKKLRKIITERAAQSGIIDAH
ncbi:MAG: RNA polymerase sigma factor RpoH [Alphaproteobacteria bacterium]|nr:RNA polymerase sigma factor RpoH [Alphaproteobacteria bacterium]MBE8219958.1 RNA polymerase sigma factor RpoH [Alphaproteobacteria bacterium]